MGFVDKKKTIKYQIEHPLYHFVSKKLKPYSDFLPLQTYVCVWHTTQDTFNDEITLN